MIAARLSGIGVAFLATLALLAPVQEPLEAQETEFAEERAEPEWASSDLLYICNQGDATVSILDIETLEVVHTVDLARYGFSRNAKPHHVVVEPDGSAWYLSLIGENRVLKFDRENRMLASTEFETPGMLLLHPSEDLLFVARSMSAVDPPSRIGVFSRSDLEGEEWEVFLPRPHALASSGDGNVVYTGSLAVNQIAAIDLASQEVEVTEVEGSSHSFVQFAVSPDGSMLVATAELTAQAMLFDLEEPTRPRLLGHIGTDARPWHPVYHPNGTVWFGNKGSSTVLVLNPEQRRLVDRLEAEGLADPHGSAVSPDGRYVFISSNAGGELLVGDPGDRGGAPHGSVAVFDAENRGLVKVIPVGRSTSGLGVRSGS